VAGEALSKTEEKQLGFFCFVFVLKDQSTTVKLEGLVKGSPARLSSIIDIQSILPSA